MPTTSFPRISLCSGSNSATTRGRTLRPVSTRHWTTVCVYRGEPATRLGLHVPTSSVGPWTFPSYFIIFFSDLFLTPDKKGKQIISFNYLNLQGGAGPFRYIFLFNLPYLPQKKTFFLPNFKITSLQMRSWQSIHSGLGYSDILPLKNIYPMFEIEIGPFQSMDLKFGPSAFQNCKEFQFFEIEK